LFSEILGKIQGRPIQIYLEEKVAARRDYLKGGLGKVKPPEPWPDPPPRPKGHPNLVIKNNKIVEEEDE